MRNLIWLSLSVFAVTVVIVFYFVPAYFQAMLIWHGIASL